VWDVGWNWQLLAQVAKHRLNTPARWLPCLGLELGALSHSLSDWGGSAQTLPKRSLLRGKIKKRKLTQSLAAPDRRLKIARSIES